MRTPLEQLMRSFGWGRRVKGPVLLTRINDPPKQCIDPKGQNRLRLVRYAAHDLSVAAQRRTDQHLATCSCCREYLSRVAPHVAKSFLRHLAAHKRATKKRVKRREEKD